MEHNVLRVTLDRHAQEDQELADLGIDLYKPPAEPVPASSSVWFGSLPEGPDGRSWVRRWWDRVCPKLPGDVSRLDRMDDVS